MPEITDPRLLQRLNAGPQPSAGGMVQISGPDPFKIADNARANNADARAGGQDARDAALDAVNLQLRRLELEKAQQEAAKKAVADQSKRDIIGEARRNVEIARNLKQRSANDWFATGFGNIPTRYIPGTSAYDVAANVQTIQGSSALDKLAALRADSPTGGNPFGQMSNADMELLKATVASLDPGQSDKQFQDNMDYIIQLYSKMLPQNERQDQAPVGAMAGAMPGASGGGGNGPTPPDWSLAGSGAPNAPSGGQVTNEGKFVNDPALRGVNARVSQMIKSGASAGQVRQYLNSVQPGLGQRAQNIEDWVKFNNQHPQGKIGVNIEQVWQPASRFSSELGGAGMTAPGQFAIRTADALTAGTLDNLTPDPGVARAAMDANAESFPVADTLGNFAGNVAATAGAGKLLGAARFLPAFARGGAAADLLYGTAYGAGSADEGSRLTGGLTGGGLNLVGGKLGETGTKALGSTLTGVTDPFVQYLARRGVRMTPGQMAGGNLKALEDRWTGNAGLGAKISDKRRKGLEDFVRAAFTEGYAPANYTPQAIGAAGAEAGSNAVSNFYNQVLDPVTVQADQPFMAGLSAIKQRGARIPGELAGEVDNTLKTRVGPFIDPQTGQISGRNMQAMLQGVRGDMGDFAGKPRYDLYRKEGRAIQDEIRGLVERQSPGTVAGLDAANTAWRNSSILDDAIIAARNNDEIFTPAQLGNAVIANTKKYGGKRQAASQSRPFYELQRAGQNVLPSKVPDSGTAGRVREGSIGAKVAGMVADAARAPLYNDSLGELLRTVMLNRPDAMVRAGTAVKDNSRVGGLIGGAGLLQLLGQ